MHETRYQGHRGKPKHLQECGCETCLLYLPKPFRFVGSSDEKPNKKGCPLCFKLDRPLPDAWPLHREIPPEVKEFLKIKTCCNNCFGILQSYFKQRLMGCWGRSSPEVMKLAMLMMIRSLANYRINQPSYEAHCARWLVNWKSNPDRVRSIAETQRAR